MTRRINLLILLFIFAVVVSIFGSLTASAADRKDLKASSLAPTGAYSLPKSADGKVSVIVKFDVDSVATYRGNIPGLAATSPQATGKSRLDVNSPQVKAYESFLIQKEQAFEKAVSTSIPGARIVHRFRKIIGGVSMMLPADRVKELSRMPGVKAVYPDVLLPLDTDRSPEFIGAPQLWSQVGGQNNAGKGMIVGILDSGIWPEHPSVADDGSFPEPPAKWTGTACEFGSATPGDNPFPCNNKLIGAARFMDTFDAFGPVPLPGEFFSARDNNGHGSHTATTAAGNANVLASTGTLVSGIAPRAHLSAYKICFTNAVGQGQCFSSDSAAAIEQGILDGVDVMNFSIGGGTNPYSDAVSLAFLDAYAAGVFVAASAGNSGPGADTVSHREPWTTTAAATTTDKGFAGTAHLTADVGATLDLTGVSSTANLDTSSPVVLSGAIGDGVPGGGPSCPGVAEGESDALCCNPFPAGSLTGKLVVCKRGSNARVSKSFNVAAGGAAGMILYNPTPNTLNADAHSVPSLHINEVQGATLLTFIANQTNEAGTIVGGSNDLSGQGDVVAAFSSRGGIGQTLGISKPDVGAPGVDILAANTPAPAAPGFPTGQFFQIISGTSMASPHVCGTGALLRQLHPDWTPGQIKSAIMMTATTENTVKENGTTPATPFDIGSGRIDLNVAGRPGLTISETSENYILLADNLSKSNYPSLYVPVLAGIVTVERTLKSVDNKTRLWNIDVESPSDLNIFVQNNVLLSAGQKKKIKILIDASDVPLGEVRHARLLLQTHRSHHDGGPVHLNFPITIVRRQGPLTLEKTCDPLSIKKGEHTTCTINVTNTTFENENITVTDFVPRELDVVGVSGGFKLGNLIFFHGQLAGGTPPQISVADGTSPFGYFPLSGLGVPKQAGFGDETIVNFTLTAPLSYLYAGATHNVFGVTSNGYVIVGGGTAADVQFNNQNLPNPVAPNNTLAAFWTDLNPGVAGTNDGIRVAVLSTGGPAPLRWAIVDFQNVPNFTSASGVNSFQIWIGLNGVQDISYAYGSTTSGEGGALTVGAENLFGNSGQNYYFNGTGTLPTPTTEIVVTGTPALPGETHTISIDAKGKRIGDWRNCAELFSDALFGIATSCVDGDVTQ